MPIYINGAKVEEGGGTEPVDLSALVAAIGEPEASESDDVATLAGHITDDKTDMAANLVADGIVALANENLVDLVDKIPDIADLGQTTIAAAIGAGEAAAGESFTVLAGHITTDKGTIATNLSNDGVTAAGSETLAALAAKIPGIADGGQSTIATGIGAGEAAASDSFTTLAGYITTDKGTIATNLSNDGVTAAGTETLAALAAKIPGIADAGQSTIATAIGATEASSSDSFTTLAGYVTTDKGTMATNLAAKGVTAAGSETLAALSAKINDIVMGVDLGGTTETATLLTDVSANDILIGSHLVKQSNPSTLPATTGNSVAHISFGGTDYLAVASGTSPYIRTYSWSGSAWSVIADPATLPPSASYGVDFYEFSGVLYMAVVHAASPYVSIYTLDTGAWVKMSTPSSSLPTGTGYGVSFSESGSELYCGVAHASSPFMSIYKFNGSAWGKMNNPSALPAGTGYGVYFNHIGGVHYCAIGHNASPYVSIYTRSVNTWTKQTDPTNLPTGIGKGIAFHTIGTDEYLVVSHDSPPFVTIYIWSGSEFVKQNNPLIVPAGNTGNAIKIKQLGSDYYMAVAQTLAPFLTVYKLVSGSWFHMGGIDVVSSTGNGITLANIGGNNYVISANSGSPYMSMYKMEVKVAKQSTTVSAVLQANTFLAYATASGTTGDSITIKTLRY